MASYLYDSWGALTSSTESFASGWTNPYRYDGRDGARYDASDGLYWLSVRAYDPTLGRFLSRDPLGRAPLFVADNPYVYAGNNPLSNVDPSGERYTMARGGGPISPSSSSRVKSTRGQSNLWSGIRDKPEFFAGLGIALGGLAILGAAFASIFASESWNPLLVGVLQFAGRIVVQAGGAVAQVISQALQHIMDSLVYVNPWIRVAIDALALLSDFAVMVISFLVGANAILARGRQAWTFLQKMVFLLKSFAGAAPGGVINLAVTAAASSAGGLFSGFASAVWDTFTLVRDVKAAMRA